MTDGKKLGRADVDAALKAWPEVERAPEEWEKSARSVEAKIAGGAVSARASEPGAASDLLRAPLPPGLEEVQDSAPSKMQTTERERDRRSLQDLAKLASSPSLTPAPPRASAPPSSASASGGAVESKSENDSGIVDLKMMAVTDPGAAERAKTTPLASAELFADDPAEPAPSSRSVSKSGANTAAIATPLASAPVHAVAVAPTSVRPAAARVGTPTRGPWLALGGVASIFAIAAVAVFMVKASRHDATAQLPVPSDPVAAEPAAVGPVAAAPVPQPPPVATATTTPAPGSVVDPSNLPIAQTDTVRRGHASTKSAAPKTDTTAASPPPPDPKLVAKDLPPSTAPSGSLNDALRQAAGASGDTSAAPAPAAGGPSYAPGSVPQKPSQGAVTGALGAVMQNARACLEPDGPISRATVTFESGGTVQAIRVTGSAAGKPAEACIKAALTQAKVPPFAQSTYVANVTIRPN